MKYNKIYGGKPRGAYPDAWAENCEGPKCDEKKSIKPRPKPVERKTEQKDNQVTIDFKNLIQIASDAALIALEYDNKFTQINNDNDRIKAIQFYEMAIRTLQIIVSQKGFHNSNINQRLIEYIERNELLSQHKGRGGKRNRKSKKNVKKY